jgi:predicted outer membrane repeat protein
MMPKVKIYGSFAGSEQRPEARSFGAADSSILLGNQASVVRNDRNGLDTSALLDGFKITGGEALEGTSNSKYGGGIYNRGVSATFSHLVITSNSAADIGGGMLNDNGASPLIQNVIFSHNSAGIRGGAGLANFSGSNARLMNVLFYGNSSSQGNGGALYNSGSVTTLINTTISDNLTTGLGGAIYSTGAGAQVKAYNSIFWNNRSSSGTANEFGNSGSLSIELSHTICRFGPDNITGAVNLLGAIKDEDPGFVDQKTGNYQLGAGSPAIDAGQNEYAPGTLTKDLMGGNRIESGVIDMGAYEYQASVLPVDIDSIKGYAAQQIATIEWTSGVEVSLGSYELQSSGNGVDFRPVGSMAPKGSGSHYVYKTAQYIQNSYYRLKLIDQDGRYYFSQVIRVVDNGIQSSQQDTKELKLILYPNPVGDIIKLQANKEGLIRIYNLQGQEVLSRQLQVGVNQMNVAGLSSGVYLVKFNGREGRFVKK